MVPGSQHQIGSTSYLAVLCSCQNSKKTLWVVKGHLEDDSRARDGKQIWVHEGHLEDDSRARDLIAHILGSQVALHIRLHFLEGVDGCSGHTIAIWDKLLVLLLVGWAICFACTVHGQSKILNLGHLHQVHALLCE